MSIVDAVEKAKRLARNSGTDYRGSSRRARQAPVPEMPQSHRESVQLAGGSARDTGIEPVVFPQCAYSPKIAARSRIIVPDAPQSLLKAATSSYRMLRTRLLQRCRTNSWGVLGLTSPGPSEGKTVTAINLAISVAREGNSEVFLLDLDMRNPSVWRYLGAKPDREIAEFFRDEATAQEVLFSTGIPNLAIAGSVRSESDASELLASGRLQQMIEYLQRIANNPLILVDLPPVVNTDDALVVAPRLDAIAVVASEGVTRRDNLEKALELLADFTVAGVILNQSMESLGSDYYGVY